VTADCFILIYGIAAVASLHVFTANAHDVFGRLNSWGWITLIIGVLQRLAAAGGADGPGWFAVPVGALNSIDRVSFLPACPFWSLMIIAVHVVALRGCAPTAAARTWLH
jgi:hypothetical protein